MKTTIDIPDELATEVKRLAERSGMDADEQLLRLFHIAVALESLPFAELEQLARRLSALRTIRNTVVHGTAGRPAGSLAISTDPSTGLPVIHSPPEAPIHSMTPDEVLALEQSTLEDEDFERAGLPI